MRMYRNSNFVQANIMIFILGLVLFAALVMLPLFLQTLLGYTAQSAGLVLSGGGLLLLFLMPITGTLVSRFQARYIIAFGWLALSLAPYYSTQHFGLQISFQSASVMRVIQVFGLGFLFRPDQSGFLRRNAG